MAARKPPPGTRYRLRLYQRLFGMLVWPAFLLAIGAYVLWWIALDYSILSAGRGFLLLVVILSGLLYVFSLVAPVFCFVQCRADYLLVSTPFYRLTISYSRLGSITPVNFGTKYPFNQQRWSQRRFLGPLFREQKTGQLTVVSVEVKKFPLPLWWLKLWFNDYMFNPTAAGFLFMVADWLALSHQLEDYREAWRSRRTAKTTYASAASRILKGDKR